MTEHNCTKLSDEEKLEVLADWFDSKYPGDPNPEVQNDLRAIARRYLARGEEIRRLKAKDEMLAKAIDKQDKALNIVEEKIEGHEAAMQEALELLKEEKLKCHAWKHSAVCKVGAILRARLEKP